MFIRNYPRRFFVHGSVVMICALGIVSSALYFLVARIAREPLGVTWLAVALFGGGLLLILARRAYWRTQLTIAKFVAEAIPISSSHTFVDKLHPRVSTQQEAQKSELALLQMTLGPRVF